VPTADPNFHRLFQQAWPEGEYRRFQLGFVVDDLLAAADCWVRVFVPPPVYDDLQCHDDTGAEFG